MKGAMQENKFLSIKHLFKLIQIRTEAILVHATDLGNSSQAVLSREHFTFRRLHSCVYSEKRVALQRICAKPLILSAIYCYLYTVCVHLCIYLFCFSHMH